MIDTTCTTRRARCSRVLHVIAACAIGGMHPGIASAAPQGNFGDPRWFWMQTIAEDPEPALASQFGGAVAVDGDLLVIGAPFCEVDGLQAGAAYVYRLVDSGWALEATLTSADPQHAALFGWSVGVAVASQREVIVVGESGRDVGSSIDAGAVTIYERDGGVWHSVGGANGGDDYTGFGYAVDTDGTSLLVGAPSTNAFRGAAIMLRRDASSGSWTFDHDTRPAAGDEMAGYYGISVALNGDLALTGAMTARLAGEGVGAAEIANAFAGGPLSARIVLHAQEPVAGDEFGRAVAASGRLFAVGAPGADESPSNTNTGAVYVFVLAEDTAHLDARLASALPQENATFGASVALSGDTLIAGEPKRTVFLFGSEFVSAGAISLFGRSDFGVWDLEMPFYNLGVNEGFGEAVAIDGARAIGGMPRHGSGATWYVERDTVFVDGFEDTAPE
jgi:FG-GAP repeat protein